MRTHRDFIDRSIRGVLALLKESLFSDECASRSGFFQRLDPRIKTAGVAVFLMAVLFSRSIIVLFVFYAICLALVSVSRIGLGFFMKRTWVFIPLFSLCIAIPALFSAVTPGEEWVRGSVLGYTFIVTRQGAYGALLFVGRVIGSVSFVVLLSITTKHFELLKVLRMFGVPQIFVMVLGMCYRYVYLFIETIENTYLAIRSRVGGQIHYKKGQHLVAWNIASLWNRSYQLNEAVYGAMLSRGYTGEPVILDRFKSAPRDWVWLAFAVTVSAGLIFIGARRGVV